MTPEELLALLVVLPLGLAAGVDLYLTLLFLAMAGRLVWETSPPGTLGDLAIPWVLASAAVLYLVERWMDRRPLGSLCWNGAHTVVRPLAGALLALMALSGLDQTPQLLGVMAAGALTLATHVTRSGWSLLLAIAPARARLRLLVSVAEDIGVLALLSVLLDAPLLAVAFAAVATALALPAGRWASPAFGFALRLLWDLARSLAHERRWQGPERFPRWIRRALEAAEPVPGGRLRGSPAAAMTLPGLGLFRRGWVVVRGGSPLFLCRRGGGVHTVDLGGAQALAVTPTTLHTRLELGGPQKRPFSLYFSLNGPSAEDLRAEFLVP